MTENKLLFIALIAAMLSIPLAFVAGKYAQTKKCERHLREVIEALRK